MQGILSQIARDTVQSIGVEFLAALVKSIREAMEANLVFITTGVGNPAHRARSMASWRKSGPNDSFEYDLEGTPCRLVYNGETVVISKALYQRFPRERGYESYIGVPLRSGSGRVMGHLAVLSEKPLDMQQEGTAIVQLFALRAEAELQRLEHEREREALITSLARTNRRLADRHDALHRSNNSKTILLGMVAHDLRNPLAAILNRGELVQSLLAKLNIANETSAMASESCNIIISTVERLDRLITATLSQMRDDIVSVQLHMEEFPLDRAIATVVALNAPAAKRKSITVTLEEPADIMAKGDEDRIVEAVDNLVQNAIKYCAPGLDIRIGCHVSGDMAEISVHDNGQGMSPEDCALAFKTFQRLSAKPTAGEPSSGLGLAIVKAIAEAHGGAARVESQGKGRGATFTITLPLADIKPAGLG